MHEKTKSRGTQFTQILLTCLALAAMFSVFCGGRAGADNIFFD